MGRTFSLFRASFQGHSGKAGTVKPDEEQDIPAGEDNSDILAKNIDVDLMIGRLALNRILRSMDQPETF